MGGKKLLVADDSLTIQKVIRLALLHEGYEIQAVADGMDAIQQITVIRPDLVLIDAALPEKSAFEVKAEVDSHDDLKEIRFILMSSAFETVDEAQVNAARFHARLRKPFDPAQLRQALMDAQLFSAAEPAKADPASEALASVLEDTGTINPNIETIHDWGKLSVSQDDLPPLPLEPEIPPITSPLPDDKSLEMFEVPMHEDIRELTEDTMKISGLSDYQWSIQEGAGKPLATPPQFSEPAPLSQSVLSEPSHLPYTAQQLDELVQKQVEAALTKFLQKNLPELAEKLVQKEIHRLLSEA